MTKVKEIEKLMPVSIMITFPEIGLVCIENESSFGSKIYSLYEVDSFWTCCTGKTRC
jgi:hypothetical protein